LKISEGDRKWQMAGNVPVPFVLRTWRWFFDILAEDARIQNPEGLACAYRLLKPVEGK
jgi:hypothetical protein